MSPARYAVTAASSGLAPYAPQMRLIAPEPRSITATRWLRHPSATKPSLAFMSNDTPAAPPNASIAALLASRGDPPPPPHPLRSDGAPPMRAGPLPRPPRPRPRAADAYAVSAAAAAAATAPPCPNCLMSVPVWESSSRPRSVLPPPPIQTLSFASTAMSAFSDGQSMPESLPPQWATSAPAGLNSSTFGAGVQQSLVGGLVPEPASLRGLNESVRFTT